MLDDAFLVPRPGRNRDNGDVYLLLAAWERLSDTDLDAVEREIEWVDNQAALGVASIQMDVDAAWNSAFLPELRDVEALDGRNMFVAAKAVEAFAEVIVDPFSSHYDRVFRFGQTGRLWGMADSGWFFVFLGSRPEQKPEAPRIAGAFLASPGWLSWQESLATAARPGHGAPPE